MSSSVAAAEVQRALAGLRESIAGAVVKHGIKRQPLLVAVSKTKPAEAVQYAYAAGCRHFGENYVQELVDKAALPSLAPAAMPGLQWHFIGHLQTNKARAVARIPNLALVESVDSVKLASALDKACVAAARPAPLPVLIQVNTSGEASKFGCEPALALDLFQHVLRQCPALEPRGLMTIGRLADGPQPDCFETLARIRDEICAKFGATAHAAAPAVAAAADSSAAASAATLSAPSAAVPALSADVSTRTIDPSTFELSMGMSGDWECALEKGATELRIGSTIFGARDYGNKEAAGKVTTEGDEQHSGTDDEGAK